MISSIQNLDLLILNFIQNNCHNTVLDKIMIFFTKIGDLGAIWIALSILFIITRKYRKVGLLMLSAIFLSSLIGEGLLKHLIKRPRPFLYLNIENLLVKKPSSYSFPSGHTTASFAAVGICMSKLKKYRFHILTLAILISFSRLYVMVHYPSDVFAGIILGLVSAKIILEIDKKYKKSAT